MTKPLLKTGVISNFKLKAEMVDDVAIINGEAELGDPINGKIRFNVEPSGELISITSQDKLLFGLLE